MPGPGATSPSTATTRPTPSTESRLAPSTLLSFYRAGSLIATGACPSGASNVGTAPIYVGGLPDIANNQNLVGAIECVLVWDTALSASQVALLSDNPYVLWGDWEDDDGE